MKLCFLDIHSCSRSLVYFLFSALAFIPTFAQTDSAKLTGRVVASSGSILVRARVELMDIDRRTKRIANTNSKGIYLFPTTKPGHYQVTVSARGFRTLVLNNLTLYTQEDLQENFHLPPGDLLETINAKAKGTLTATTGTVGTVVEQSLVAQLPLNGRSFQTLFQLAPGVVVTSTNFANEGQFSVNGQRSNANEVLVDGVSANFGISPNISIGQSAGGALPALNAFGGTNSLVSVDDVQEFAVLTSSYAPEFGRFPGGQISIVTRSGQSRWHGDAYDDLRNDIFDANDWFSNKEGLPRPALRQNDYGASLGGPVRGGKTFFFGSYEGLILRQPTSNQTDVPSLVTRQLAIPSIRPFVNAYPLPTGPSHSNGLASSTYSFSNASGLNSFSLRLDHDDSGAFAVFARYFQSVSDRKERGAATNSLSTVTRTHIFLQGFTFGMSYFPGLHFSADLRLNISRSSAMSQDTLDGFGGAVPPSPKDLFFGPFTAQNAVFQFFPDVADGVRALSIGRNVQNSQRQVQVVPNAALQAGKHTIKMGVDFRKLSPVSAPAIYTQQTFFPNVHLSISGIGSFSSIGSFVPVRSTFHNYSAYIQDSWNVSQRVQLTYGSRWDYDPGPVARGDNGSSPARVRDVAGMELIPELSNKPLYHTPVGNLAPRIGLAYGLRNSGNKQCLLTAGAGLFYDLGTGEAGNAASGLFFPFSAQRFLIGSPFPLSRSDAGAPPLNSQPPFSAIQSFPSTLRMPATWHWNLSVQQALGRGNTLNVGYVGARGQQLLRTEEFIGGTAGLSPDFTQLLVTNNGGHSSYNSLQVRFQSVGHATYHLIASYSLSHSLDNVSKDAIFDGIPARFVNPRLDYSSSDFDIRHTATVGAEYTSRISKRWAANWSFAPILYIRSAPPVDVVYSRDIGFGIYDFRPDGVPGVPAYTEDLSAPGGRRINSSALHVPIEARQGTLPRNFYRGFSLVELDLSLMRSFQLTKNGNLEMRLDVFNVCNQPNFASPSGRLGVLGSDGLLLQPGFGVAQATAAQGFQPDSKGSGLSSIYQIGGPRSLQIEARWRF